PGAGGERAMVAAAAQQGVRLRGLSEYYLARPELCRADTVVAGYSALKEADVEKVAQALARAWLS
ncbi:MAG: PLP-dependent aminotransferase family protein, partial [Gemmiger formicilis]|nr:PLP-dependent aminotransferase family protein [Gemmiger formicilis]